MESQQASLAVRSIVPGRNPRDYFDPNEMSELEDSVRMNGIFQPILVRPFGEVYQIVAGERRYRAAKSVFGEDYKIPVVVKELTDEQADQLALIENIQRANMSPTEEAAAAAKILAYCNGDRTETAKRLGWSLSVLNSRLALMNCSEAVRAALNERKIQLGHAELLASAPRDKQDKALEGIIKHKVTVAAVKQNLAQYAKSMAGAIFDKTQCASCQHNSDNQAALFAESVGTGYCTNGNCYDEKTEVELAARRDALLTEVPRAEIVRPGDNFKVIKVVAEGATGVGVEQATACRGCANFGAVVSAVPDKMGKTFRDQCFDLACNSKKVAARIRAEQQASEQAKAQQLQQQQQQQQQPQAASTASAPAASAAKSHSQAATVKAATQVTVADSNRVKEYRVNIWRAAARKELMAQTALNPVVLIALCMSHNSRHINSDKLTDGFRKITGTANSYLSKIDAALTDIAALEPQQRDKMMLGLAASAMENIEEGVLLKVMAFMNIDLARHWKLNKEFLSLLTKSEMEAVADELGLKAALGDKFGKLVKQKNEDIITGLLGVDGFDYGGKIPRSMQYERQ